MAVHMRNGIQYGGIPNGTVKGVNPSTVPTTVKQLNQIGTVGNIAPVTIPSAVKFSNGDTLETAIGSVATIETSPAVAAHDAGEYIFYNGQMYKVIAAIAVGETLTVDTNITSTNVGSELTALNNGLMKYPDYSANGILYNFSTSAITLNYTAPENCYMNIHVINTVASSLSVNGVVVASSARAGDYHQLSYAGYLKEGDTVTSSGIVRGIIFKLR